MEPNPKSRIEPLAPQESEALLQALDDEYRAWATYDQVIKDFGPVRPFVNIREAEGRHIEALLGLCRRYRVTAPGNPWIGKAPRYASVSEACQSGIEAEVANAALYDRLLASTARRDVRAVYDALRLASQDRHLPAFRRCAGRRSPQSRQAQPGDETVTPVRSPD
jgi:hypothetical protein